MKRTQGRPRRGTDDGGRQQLLEGARNFLRSSTERNVSRQEIARFAGFAPALVTYYFSTKSGFLLAATKPVIEEAIEKVNAAIDANASFHDRLQKIVFLFISFSARNGRILDVFVEAAMQAGDEGSQTLVLGVFSKMQRFFAEGAQSGEWIEFEPTFFILALWGMCKFVGEPPLFPVWALVPDMPQEDLWRQQATVLVELLINGIKAPR